MNGIGDTVSQNLFPNVYRLLRILITIPVSAATAERSFSSLRRLKTYLRSTMVQKRLNAVAVMNVHKHVLDSICLETVANDFISKSESRKNTFGIFVKDDN